jgi:hypothetical protein
VSWGHLRQFVVNRIDGGEQYIDHAFVHLLLEHLPRRAPHIITDLALTLDKVSVVAYLDLHHAVLKAVDNGRTESGIFQLFDV